MVTRIINFFDKLEDRIRGTLSRRPIWYAIIGGIGIVLFWKGVWETAELFPSLFGPPSVIAGIAILLLTGLLVSFFVGDSIILSGFKQEKKLAEKTESEVRAEGDIDKLILEKLDTIEAELEERKEKQ